MTFATNESGRVYNKGHSIPDELRREIIMGLNWNISVMWVSMLSSSYIPIDFERRVSENDFIIENLCGSLLIIVVSQSKRNAIAANQSSLQPTFGHFEYIWLFIEKSGAAF